MLIFFRFSKFAKDSWAVKKRKCGFGKSDWFSSLEFSLAQNSSKINCKITTKKIKYPARTDQYFTREEANTMDAT